jgi:hypothetical protein
MLSKQ